MEYPNIIRKLFTEPWCITGEAHLSMQRTLEAHLAGGSQVPTALRLGTSNGFNAAAIGLNPPKSVGSRVYTSGSMAYIPVRGIIGKGLSSMETMCGGYSVDQLEADVATALDDPSVKKILIGFNSPGGSVTGVPEAGSMIKAAMTQKPIYGFTDTQSCSAAYWLMSQCTAVYATGSATVGSIGVYLALLDRSEEMTQRGQKLKLFKAGAHKGMGLPGNQMTPEDEALLQAGVDKVYGLFTKAVTSARPKVEKATMQGQTFMGMDSRANGLIDAQVTGLGALIKRLS
jgi:signal peptide peptidase SppA